MKMYDNFLGLNICNITLDFLPADTNERLEENKKIAGEDWYYCSHPLSYKINDIGHRSNNINEIDLSNYILFTGCSHTFGIGLELEKLYGVKIANLLKTDYYNLSIPGTGIDVMEYNLLMWFGKIKQPPKLLIIQMPDHTRYCSYNPYIGNSFFVETGSWAVDKDEQRMIVDCETSGFFSARKLLTYKNIDNIATCPIIYVNVAGQANRNNDGLKLRNLDLARDLAHYGNKSHETFTNDLHEFIKVAYPNLLNTAA